MERERSPVFSDLDGRRDIARALLQAARQGQRQIRLIVGVLGAVQRRVSAVGVGTTFRFDLPR